MEKSKALGAAVVGIIVIAVLVLIAVSLKGKAKHESAGKVVSPEKMLPGGISTREAAPANIAVPDEKASGTPANVAIPKVTGPANPMNTATFRSYDIKVTGDRFVPDTVIVNVGDSVQMDFMAVDKEYDLTQADFGIKTPLPKGVKKTWGMTATTQGDFLFYCVSCGGPEKGPQGHLIITGPKKP